MQLHRLVQAILLNRQATDPARAELAGVAVRLLRAVVPANPWNNPATWPTWRQLLPHVLTTTSRDLETITICNHTDGTDDHHPDSRASRAYS